MARSGILVFLFFLSGILALIYEALWMRRFALVFGSAAPATAAVLAAYFAGLALGSFWIGKRVATSKSPLKLYAKLEVGISAGALLVEVWLHFFQFIPASGLAAKTALAFLALALPTICMGGTLPALGALVDRGQHHLGRTAGLLYVVNTAGAAIGVLLIPFVLLPNVGSRGSLLICVVGNLLVAAVAWSLKISAPLERTEREPFTKFAALAFFSGFVAFVVQVLWNRAFAQVHENSLHSFAIIAAVFILALAVGGQIARVRLNLSLEGVWIAAGALLLFSALLFIWRTDGLKYVGGSWKLLELAMLVVFPVATLIGIAMPIIFERAGKEARNSGRVLGQLLTANLAGAVVGSLVAGFLLPQTFGLWLGLVFAAVLLLGVGVYRKPKLSFLILLFLPIGFYISKFPRVRVLSPDKLVAMTEGPHGVVAVVENDRSRRLKLNNSYVLGGTLAVGDERMQSHIPLLLHPRPERVAYMGMGTGITAGGALFHPVKQITLLELVPEVVDAARVHFADANMRLLEQPQTRVIVEDARNFLRRTDEKFDVIIGDLVVPWRAGEGALFTKENFEAAKKALAPGGVFCQWLPMFQLSKEQFDSLLVTFLSVFPEAHIWRGDFSPTEPSLGLVAGPMDRSVVERRLKEMKADPMNPHLIEPAAVWMSIVSTTTGVAGNAPLNTEDRPWVELSGRAEKLFVGRPFVEWCATGNGDRAGQALAEFTLASSNGDSTGARRAQEELRRLVSAELFRALFP